MADRSVLRQAAGEVYGAYGTTLNKVKELLTFDNINDVDVLHLFNETNRNTGKRPDTVSDEKKAIYKKHGENRIFEEVDPTHDSYVNEKGQRVTFQVPKDE